MSCLLPGLIGIIPEVFIETDPIYWLMLQNPLNALFSSHMHCLLWIRIQAFSIQKPVLVYADSIKHFHEIR